MYNFGSDHFSGPISWPYILKISQARKNVFILVFFRKGIIRQQDPAVNSKLDFGCGISVYSCGVPILPASYHDIGTFSAAPINIMDDDSSMVSWHLHVTQTTTNYMHCLAPYLMGLSCYRTLSVFNQINIMSFMSRN